MNNEKYRNLINYISYFEDNDRRFYDLHPAVKNKDGSITLGYATYDERFNLFVEEFYRSDLEDHDYLEHIRKVKTEGDNVYDFIGEADFELLKAIFTFFIRGEQSCTGFWADAIRGKAFLKILYRLKSIVM